MPHNDVLDNQEKKEDTLQSLLAPPKRTRIAESDEITPGIPITPRNSTDLLSSSTFIRRGVSVLIKHCAICNMRVSINPTDFTTIKFLVRVLVLVPVGFHSCACGHVA